jgi:rare lipoprotein A
VEPSTPRAPSTSEAPAPVESAPRKSGGYYLDDGPGAVQPPDLDLLPDATPKVEKYASGANRPYNVFGVDYVPDLSGKPYKEKGVGSWYGRKFHGQRTSSGEIYDMYAMTAAHPTLPIPCYALVTNLTNGKSVIVRVNDRGPFLHNRIMDLSYAAALKLGYLSSGSSQIQVEEILPTDIAAGRIPITSNGLYVASIAAGGARTPLPNFGTRSPPEAPPVNVALVTMPPVGGRSTPGDGSQGGAGSPGPAASTSSPTVAPTVATSAPEPADSGFTSPLPADLSARGIPADLIPDPQPPAKLPEVAAADGFYLQLGAFRVRAGADSFAAHVARELDPSIASRLHVSDANGLFRVRVGPFGRRADADQVANHLRAAIAQPILVMPEGAAR